MQGQTARNTQHLVARPGASAGKSGANPALPRSGERGRTPQRGVTPGALACHWRKLRWEDAASRVIRKPEDRLAPLWLRLRLAGGRNAACRR